MAVFRIKKTRDYTVMSNHHLRNAGLSMKSKWLLSMMLSLPQDWNYTTRDLAKICKGGTDNIGSALKELELAGYIVRNRLRDSKGKIVDVQYVIYETPHPPDTGQLCDDELYTACPDTGTPDMDTPYLENRPQLMQLINRENTLKKKTLIHEARKNQALFNQASKLPQELTEPDGTECMSERAVGN